ncbi:MAG: hypothetical protein FWB95_07155 [Treponema sp.]|nr:hypothetical protein [Treponema sp.]
MSKKESWLTEYCNEHLPDKEWEEFMKNDTVFKPTVRLFMHNFARNFRRWKPVFTLRMFFQKVFRKNHISDIETWNSYTYMSKLILPHLKAYKKEKRFGYPSEFSEYEDTSGRWNSKEEYDQAIKDGTLIGGGYEAWEEALDKIIFAVEYTVYEAFNEKKLKKLVIDKYGEFPWSDDLQCDYELLRKIETCVDEGFKLMGIHWRTLWD